MAEDLVLDTAIRDWVLIPLSVVMVLIGVLRYFVSKLMKGSSQVPDPKIVKEGQVIIRARNLRAGANYIPSKSFRARKTYYSNEENGLLHVPKGQAQNPQAQMFSDPNMAMDMMKKNLSMIIPQTLTFAWVNFFFSGFVAAKIPFPLTHLNLRKFDSRELINNSRSVKDRFIRCMANPRRVKMVAKQIRRELSDMLLTDKVLQYAVLPEAALGADRYLSSLTTISDVEVSTDLQVVKVYVSVFGDERGKEVALTGLKSKAKYVRSELGRRMKLRLTPEIRFIEDESLERGSRVLAILDRIKDENESKKSPSTAANDGLSDQSDDGGDWEDDDPDDEGIIYVK